MAKTSLHETVENVLDQLRGAWRYRQVALWVAWTVSLVLWTVVFLIPNSYQASARVFIDTRTTLSEATQGIGLGEDIGSQIQRVRQALLGWPELQRVAEGTDLYAGALTAPAKQQVLEKLRDNIDLAGDLSRDGAAVFTITYRNHSRAEALKVVDRLLNTFVEGTLGGKRQGSKEAQQFLVSQIDDYAHRLSAAEQRLADFKRKHVGLMPGQQGDYFTHLQNETDALTKAKNNLTIAMRRRDALAQELQTGQPYELASAGGASSGAGVRPADTDTERQIAQTQQRLDNLLLRFTPKYPDVIAAQQTLKRLKARQKAELAAANQGDPTAAANLGLAASPVYQKIQEQYNQEQVVIASMQQDIADREKTVAALRAKVDTAPEIEAELSKLNRDYDVTRAQYNALLVRLDRARLGQQAMNTGIVKFQVIDPPSAGFKPVAPRRRLLVVLCLLLAIAAGVASAYVLYLLRPVFVSNRQLGAVTGLQVLGAVSMAWAERYHAGRRYKDALYFGCAIGLFAFAVFVLLWAEHISAAVRGLLA